MMLKIFPSFIENPTQFVDPVPLTGRKFSKGRVTVLACTNATGTERFPLLFVGRAARPKCFGGEAPAQFGLDYAYNERSWMNRELFFGWSRPFNEHIARNTEKQV